MNDFEMELRMDEIVAQAKIDVLKELADADMSIGAAAGIGIREVNNKRRARHTLKKYLAHQAKQMEDEF